MVALQRILLATARPTRAQIVAAPGTGESFPTVGACCCDVKGVRRGRPRQQAAHAATADHSRLPANACTRTLPAQHGDISASRGRIRHLAIKDFSSARSAACNIMVGTPAPIAAQPHPGGHRSGNEESHRIGGSAHGSLFTKARCRLPHRGASIEAVTLFVLAGRARECSWPWDWACACQCRRRRMQSSLRRRRPDLDAAG